MAKQQAITAGLVVPLTSALSSPDGEVRRLSSHALAALAQVLSGRAAMARAGTVPALAAACSGTEAVVATLEVGVMTVRLPESTARAHDSAEAGMLLEKARHDTSAPAAAHHRCLQWELLQLLGQHVGSLIPLCHCSGKQAVAQCCDQVLCPCMKLAGTPPGSACLTLWLCRPSASAQMERQPCCSMLAACCPPC